MPDLKNVIKGLEYHSEGNCFKSEDDEIGCPYWKDSFCSQHLCSDALALLKAQEPEAMDAPKPDSDIGCWYDITHNYTLEQVVSALKEQKPRLVTKADFENADEYGFIPAWYEGLVNKEGWWNCIPKEALETAKEDGCRYWTSKPSLKQMEETPWP